MNVNGYLSDFREENELVIDGTLFKHKEIHRYTWESPDGVTKNQIDHIAVNRTWAVSLRDVRTKRGADVGSDHVLLIGKFKLSLKAKTKVVAKKKLNVKRLKNQVVADKF